MLAVIPDYRKFSFELPRFQCIILPRFFVRAVYKSDNTDSRIKMGGIKFKGEREQNIPSPHSIFILNTEPSLPEFLPLSVVHYSARTHLAIVTLLHAVGVVCCEQFPHQSICIRQV